MAAKKISPSRPSPLTRLYTTLQGAFTVYLLYITVGSGVVLVTMELTSLSIETLLFWHPKFLPLISVVSVGIGAVCGAYWPLFKRESKQQELDLLRPRCDCAKWLSIGLCFIAPVSLIGVFTVTEWLTNVLALGGILLVCTYTYAYGVGSAPETPA